MTIKYGKPYRYANGAVAVFTHTDNYGNVVGTITDDRGERRHVEGPDAFEKDECMEEIVSSYSIAVLVPPPVEPPPVEIEITEDERGTEWTSSTTAPKSEPTGGKAKSRKRT